MTYYRKSPVFLLGSVVALVVGIVWLALFFSQVNGFPYLMIGVGVLGSWVIIWLKKVFAISGEELYSRDQRPPVVYLRSFGDDEKFKANNSGGIYFNNSQMFEESLVNTLKQLGPVMAIGRPNERLPPLGAARMYVGDDSWQERVAALIDESSLIVLVLGKTAGLGWEISTLKDRGAWHKALFVLPPTNEPDLYERWSTFHSHVDPTGELLPERVASSTLFATGNRDGTVTLIENPKVRRKKWSAKYRWSAYVSVLLPILMRRNSAEPSDAPKDRASRFENGNSTLGDR